MKRKYPSIALALFALQYTGLAEDIKTTDGHEYKAVEITRVEPDGVLAMTGDGIVKIAFKILPADIQKRYGYDAGAAAKFAVQQNAASAEKQRQLSEERDSINRRQLEFDKERAKSVEALSSATKGGIDSPGAAYGNTPEQGEVRYSPAVCMGTKKAVITGNPDFKHTSTSFVERQNLTMRMSMRRFTRLTNAFSKKAENHGHAVALHFMHYNFCRIHQTLRVTPAMEAGIANHVWSIAEMVAILGVS